VCVLSAGSAADADAAPLQVITNLPGYQTLTDTKPIAVTAGQRITYYCANENAAGPTPLLSSSITAVRVDKSTQGQTAVGGPPEALRHRHHS
jgi:hypothetical protein